LIKRIEIRNFQGHKRLAINFDKGVTTIVGPSDVGKSSVIRAIKLVCFNQPGGEAFIHTGTKRCSVKLFLRSGEILYREKGKKENIYRIGDKELKAFGQGAPAEVETLLNLSKINFQDQHDSPYWFCETAGEVSRQLNQIVNLGIIDKALNNIGQDIRKAKTKMDIHKEALAKITEDLKEVAHAQDMDEALQRAEKANAQFEETRATRLECLDLVDKVKTCHETLDRVTGSAQAAHLVAKQGKAWTTVGLQRVDLARGIRSLVHNLGVVRRAPPKETLADLVALNREWEGVARVVLNLRAGVKKFKRLKGEECQLKQDAEDAQKKLMGMVKVCPLCGQQVK